MSSISIKSLKCPNCNKEFEFGTYDSINVTLNPDLKKDVLNGNIFKCRCPNCNEEGPLIYPFLYHDMEKHFMIHLANYNDDNIKDILKNVDMLAISVDSSSDEENYFLGRGANHYAHVKKIIPLIKKTFPNIKIEINTIITSQTINGLHELYNSIIKEFKNDEIYI